MTPRTCRSWSPRSLDAARAGARRPVRRLHGRPRRPRARAARGGRDAPDRPRSRPDGARARARDARAVGRSRRARARRLPRSADRVLDARGIDARRRRARRPRRLVDAVRRRRARLQLPARRAARHADGSDAGADAPPICSRDVDEAELADVIFQFGEERFSRRIARRSSTARRDGADRRRPASSRRSSAARSRARGYQRIDPATRTFQALRIWVNRELDGLDAFLAQAARAAARRARGSW